MGQRALVQAKVWRSGRGQLELRSPRRSKLVPDSNRRFGVPSTSQRSQHRSCAGFQNFARSAKTRSLAPLSPSPTPKQVGNTRATCRGVIDKTIPSPAVRNRMTGNYFMDVFGGFGFLSKATNHLGLRGCVLDTKFGPWYDATQPYQISTRRRRWKVCCRNDFTSRATNFVPSNSYLHHCFHRQLAASCPHAVRG